MNRVQITGSQSILCLSLVLVSSALAQTPQPNQSTAPANSNMSVPPATTTAPPATPSQDAQALALASLQREVGQTLSDMHALRNRVGLLSKSLLKSQFRVQIKNRASSEQVLRLLSLTLDGLPIYRASAPSDLRDDLRKLYQGGAVPGFHELGVEIEQEAKAGKDYRYKVTQRFRFEARRQKLTELTIVLDDDTDIAESFKEDGEGTYETQMALQVSVRPLNTK